jgi:hypothetical protein
VSKHAPEARGKVEEKTMKLRSSTLWFLISALIFTTGCALVRSRRENPVIEDRIGLWSREPLGTLATTAERRILLVRLNDSNSTVGRVCAEPPRDSSENIASQLSTAIEAAFRQPTANVDANARVAAASGIATSVQSLFQRTQGLQLYRDGMYNLCQGYINGIFDAPTFIGKYDTLLAASVELIKEELKVTNGKIGREVPSTEPSYRWVMVVRNDKPPIGNLKELNNMQKEMMKPGLKAAETKP